MKVLQISPCYAPAYRFGGPVKSIHELSRKLVENGVEVTVFTTNYDGVEVMDVPIGKPCSLDGVTVYYFEVKWPYSYFRCIGLKLALKDRITEFDLVHINCLYVYTTIVASSVCLDQGIPYLLTPRGMLDSNAIVMKGTKKKKVYLNLVERKPLKGASLIHYTSHGEKINAINSEWKLPSCVIGNGIDLEDYILPEYNSRFINLYPEIRDKNLVLFLGRINYIKGLDILAKAWPLVVSKIPDAHLIIVGPDSDQYKNHIIGLLKNENVISSVTFTGSLKGDDKLAVLALTKILVAPSYLESFGMSIIEAMVCKKPVVITDRVNISPEIREFHAGLVTSCDSNGIAQALVKLLHNDRKSKIMGRNGYRLVKDRYTWNKIAKDMLRTYKSIIEMGISK